MNACLSRAYTRFSQWCYDNRRATTIRMFSKLDFDMTTNLD